MSLSYLPSPPLIPGDLDTSALQSSQLALSGATLGTVVIKPSVVTVSYALTLPNAQGAANTLLRNDGSGYLSWVAPGTGGLGDVVGPASSTNTALALFSGTTGKIIQNSVVTLSSLGAMAGVASLALAGTTNSVTILPAAATTAYSITLPGAQGTAGTYLENDGTGVLRWAGGDAGLYWYSSQDNPTTGQTINAVFSGSPPPVWTNAANGISLTATNPNTSGYVNWNVAGFDFTRNFRFTVSYYMQGGGSGVQYGVGGSSSFNGWLTANNGIGFKYNTNSTSSNTQWFNNAVDVAPTLGFKVPGVTYIDSWITDIMEVRWVGPKRMGTISHGSMRNWEGSIDLTSWVPGGSFVFVGGTTSGGTFVAIQLCNGVSLEYI